MPQKQTDKLSENDIKKLLDARTNVILSAVGKKLTVNRITILADVSKKLAKMEIRINRKIDKLTTLSINSSRGSMTLKPKWKS